MTRLLALLRQRWVFSVAGLLALAVMIWFFGPYVSFAGHAPLRSVAVRLLIILILLAVWGISYLIKQLKSARSSKQLSDDLSQSDEVSNLDAQTAAEAKLLKQRFDEAMTILRKSRRKGGTGGLYELPWYVIIGPPGSGKTTALINSGLEFPLAGDFGKKPLQGVGGTRNCDWWFTDQAVLLDTAGRYLTQDSHVTVDSAAWKNFLNLLKKHRRRRPLNGVIVTISLADVMQQDERELEKHRQAIRQRIQELYTHFGMTIPVYVLLTKVDLLAGFSEFFDDLGREERSQVWGLTLPFKDETEDRAVGSEFMSEYELLLERLEQRLLLRLSQERDVQRRAMIYRFPKQLASLKDMVSHFLSDVFQTNRYEKPMLLRGVYLTSGTQEGTPIDRLMGVMAHTFGLNQPLSSASSERGKSYFITRLLTDVIFAESGLAGYNRRFETRRIWLQRAAYAGVLGVTLIASLAWLTSYSANKLHVKQVANKLADYEEVNAAEHENSLIGMLPELDSMKSIIDSAGQYDTDVPIHMRLWLYQGDALAEAARDAYTRDLNLKFLPLVADELKQQLKHSSGNAELEYETLKTYLMLAKPEHLDKVHLEQWMTLIWQHEFAGRQDVQTRLSAHLHELLSKPIRPIIIDKHQIDAARNDLSRVSMASVIYGRLKGDAYMDNNTGFRLTDLDGMGAVSLVFMRASGASLDEEIPGLYTYKGFYDFFKRENKNLVEEIRSEDWVLDTEKNKQISSQLKPLDGEIERLYMADYINTWSALLTDLRIVPFRNIQHAAQVVEVLSGPASPMIGLLNTVKKNTELSLMPDGAENIAQNKNNGSTGDAHIERLLGKTLEQPNETEAISNTNPVELQFKTLNEVTTAAKGGRPAISRVMTLLSELYGQLSMLADNQHTGMLGATSDGSGLNNTVQRLQAEASRQPEPIKTWLQTLAHNSQTVAMGTQRDQLNANWTAVMGPECHKAIDNRYPFNKDSLTEVTIDDFGRVFAPGGLLDAFFRDHLKALVDTTRNPWRWRSVESIDSGSSNMVLNQFHEADVIRSAFFQSGGQRPQIHFSLKPVYLDANTTRFILDIDGQRIEYRHGPARTSTAQWPGPSGSSRARIVFENKDGAQTVQSDDGPWAWFRILDKAKIEIMTSDRFLVTFKAGEAEMRYEIRANSVINPFVMKQLRDFKCPEVL